MDETGNFLRNRGMRMKQRWCVAGALGLALAAAPLGAQQARPPLERGLIVSTLEGAIQQPAPRLENFAITVDLSDRMLYVMNGDEVVESWPVSVGLESYPTPTGEFRVRRLLWNPSWRPPPSAWARDKKPEPPGSPGNPMGRVKIFFREPDYYIHGTGLAGSLGNARSHGCIRLRNIDAVQLARWIMINGGADRPQEWYQETIAKKETTREVTLPRPVKVRIRR